MSFIDLHCHMAWDIDDGIDSRAEAQQALQQARVDGIVKLAATPHFIPGAQKEADVREMDQRIRELRELGKEYGVPTPYNEFLYHAIRVLEAKNAGTVEGV